ncbi:GDSL-type esterase/lipase family protein [Sphingomonas sp. UV9]|uniref:GDSL-type esterase/lipase family protein n=1 Tax=Sphingomonas sp. UV9 TaxID=1851410 RepID=UPI0013E8DFF8|nr:GDSL-type esterase/lipase family protein [Sphingomonas sp. UV9]
MAVAIPVAAKWRSPKRNAPVAGPNATFDRARLRRLSKKENLVMIKAGSRGRGRSTWLYLLALVVAASAGFWVAAISFQYKLKPYFYAVKIINRVSAFDPNKDFVYRTLSTLFIEQPYRKDVTFLGDSIVAFGKWDVLLKGVDVDNHGIPGDTTQGLLLRLSRNEVVGRTAIVMLGVNDLKMEIPRAATEANLRGILQALRGKRVILVATLKTGIPSTNAKLAPIIEFERKLCTAPTCTFLNPNRDLAPMGYLKPEYTVDGVHLNWRGYRTLANQLSAATS